MAMHKLVRASASLEIQFDKDATTAPILLVLKKARDAAVEAMDALVFVDPQEAATVRQLQMEIRRYDDLVAWCREIVIEGKEADAHLAEIEREELASVVLDPEYEGEIRAAGGQPENDA